MPGGGVPSLFGLGLAFGFNPEVFDFLFNAIYFDYLFTVHGPARKITDREAFAKAWAVIK